MTQFWHWWQHLPEHMDPVIFQIGSFRLQYYGLMYLVAFGITYALATYRIKTEPRWNLSKDHLQGLLTAMIIGLVVGARLGYVIFYNLGYYAKHPLEIILPFSFKGGSYPGTGGTCGSTQRRFPILIAWRSTSRLSPQLHTKMPA